jgi:hypothetical protein
VLQQRLHQGATAEDDDLAVDLDLVLEPRHVLGDIPAQYGPGCAAGAEWNLENDSARDISRTCAPSPGEKPDIPLTQASEGAKLWFGGASIAAKRRLCSRCADASNLGF